MYEKSYEETCYDISSMGQHYRDLRTSINLIMNFNSFQICVKTHFKNE